MLKLSEKYSNLKPLLKEMLTCTNCGECRRVCPTFEDIGWDSAVARGKVLLSYGLLMGDIQPDLSVVERIYQCTTCGRCDVICASRVKVGEIIESCRRDLVEIGYGLSQHKKLVENIMRTGNPFGEEKPKLQHFSEEKSAEIGYFTGCVSAYRTVEIAESTISILRKLNINFTVFDDLCCGSVARRTGYYSEFKKLVEKNLNRIHESNVKKVVFSCAGCYRTFKKDYPPIDFEIEHVIVFLEKQKLNLREYPKSVMYHDPCHLGRHTGIYEEPRNLIRKIPKIILKEFELSREDGRCCGAGGGVRAGFPEIAQRVALKRLENVKADIVISACPFCYLNLKDSSKNLRVEVKDIVQIVNDVL